MANPVVVTEEFLRWFADHCVPSIHSQGTHGHIDGLSGAVGRAELARLEQERLRKEKAAATGRDPDLVGDVPPGWRRLPDGTWERVPEPVPAEPTPPEPTYLETDAPPGWRRDPQTGKFVQVEAATGA